MSISAAEKHTMPEERSGPPLWLKMLIGVFLVVFIAGGLYSGYLFYATVREIVAGTDLPALPVIQLPSINLPRAQADEEEVAALPEMGMQTPVVGAGEMAYDPPAAPAVAEGERTNILLLGIDRRGGKGWGYRTDTIIIVSVDTVNNTVSMLSIPRDLYLEIPGVKETRINEAMYMATAMIILAAVRPCSSEPSNRILVFPLTTISWSISMVSRRWSIHWVA